MTKLVPFLDKIINNDCLHVMREMHDDCVDCFASPPYAHMLGKPKLNKSRRADTRNTNHFLEIQQYSDDIRDLGTMTHEKYADALTEIYSGILPLMKKRAHCVINVNDVMVYKCKN